MFSFYYFFSASDYRNGSFSFILFFLLMALSSRLYRRVESLLLWAVACVEILFPLMPPFLLLSFFSRHFTQQLTHLLKVGKCTNWQRKNWLAPPLLPCPPSPQTVLSQHRSCTPAACSSSNPNFPGYSRCLVLGARPECWHALPAPLPPIPPSVSG